MQVRLHLPTKTIEDGHVSPFEQKRKLYINIEVLPTYVSIQPNMQRGNHSIMYSIPATISS